MASAWKYRRPEPLGPGEVVAPPLGRVLAGTAVAYLLAREAVERPERPVSTTEAWERVRALRPDRVRW